MHNKLATPISSNDAFRIFPVPFLVQVCAPLSKGKGPVSGFPSSKHLDWSGHCRKDDAFGGGWGSILLCREQSTVRSWSISPVNLSWDATRSPGPQTPVRDPPAPAARPAPRARHSVIRRPAFRRPRIVRNPAFRRLLSGFPRSAWEPACRRSASIRFQGAAQYCAIPRSDDSAPFPGAAKINTPPEGTNRLVTPHMAASSVWMNTCRSTQRRSAPRNASGLSRRCVLWRLRDSSSRWSGRPCGCPVGGGSRDRSNS
jgi:hypothetical protein